MLAIHAVRCNLNQVKANCRHTYTKWAEMTAAHLLNAQLCVLWHCTGFTNSQLPRQHKQPPEAALALESSQATAQAVMHTLTLLQSPMSAGQTQSQDTASPASGLQDKQAELVQLQQLDPLVANSSDVVSTDQAMASSSAMQQLQSTSAQPGFDNLGLAGSEQEPASDASDGRVASPALADVRMTTNASDPTAQMTDVTNAEEAGCAAASEAKAADAESLHMPETPTPGLTAGAYIPCLVL